MLYIQNRSSVIKYLLFNVLIHLFTDYNNFTVICLICSEVGGATIRATPLVVSLQLTRRHFFPSLVRRVRVLEEHLLLCV